MARMFTLRLCRYHRWCDTGASYPTSVRGLWWYKGCSGRRYHASHNDNSNWDFFSFFFFFHFFRLVSIKWFVQMHVSKVLSQLYFSVVYFTGRPQPFQHMHRRVRWTLHFIGCSLEIPVGLPLFKLWRETLVWWVYCVGRRRIYRWLTLTHKGMGITGFNIILST